MTIFTYRARSFGVTPTATPPANLGSPATVVGGATALDTSDGYTSYVHVQGIGDGPVLGTVSFEGLSFEFLPVGASAPTTGITRMWIECDYESGGALDTVLVFGRVGGGWFQLYGAGGVARTFGTVEAQDIPSYLFVYAAEMLAGTWVLGSGDPGYLDESQVDVTKLLLRIEAGGIPLRLIQRGDGLGMGSGRVYSTGTRQNSSRVYGSI